MPKKYTRKNKKHWFKRGGQDTDIEAGPVEDISPMKSFPPDPERFKKYDKQLIADALKPVSKEEAESIFEGPNPEQKLVKEQKMMADEDPLNKDPFERDDFTIFGEKGGKRSRKRRKHKKSKRKHSRRTKRGRR